MSTQPCTFSIRDIAKRCGVSPGTVSNVINGRDVVKPETASRIRTLMNELNYAPKTKAINSNRIMLLIPPHKNALLNSHLMSLHVGVCETAFNAGLVLSMRRCPKVLSSANQLQDLLREDGSSGVILLSMFDGYHLADTIALSQTPHVVVGASRHLQDVNQIVFDDESSAYRATRYLQELRHKRISMIYFNRKDIGHAQRYVGFAAACHGLKMDRALLEGVEIEHARPEFGAQALIRLMQLPKPPTAIIVTNAQLAEGVMTQATEMGIRVPEDLSIITYQSSQQLDYGLHHLTTLFTPAYEMGQKAVQTLHQLLQLPSNPQSRQRFAPATVELTHTMQVRQSTAPPRAE